MTGFVVFAGAYGTIVAGASLVTRAFLFAAPAVPTFALPTVAATDAPARPSSSRPSRTATLRMDRHLLPLPSYQSTYVSDLAVASVTRYDHFAASLAVPPCCTR
eukprot:2022484-Prymnesium_polylepis.1